MKENPILFSGALIRALLDGRKTQTRRVVKLPHNNPLGEWEPISIGGPDGGRTTAGETLPLQGGIWHTRTGDCLSSPYGQPGDRLWVRETWAQPVPSDPGPTFYRADYPACVPAEYENVPPADAIRWKPSIHMPRWASRILLEVTAVRVERLQDCSQSDAVAEGIEEVESLAMPGIPVWRDYGAPHPAEGFIYPTASYRSLWDSLNPPVASAFGANPWVWVVEFKRVTAGGKTT